MTATEHAPDTTGAESAPRRAPGRPLDGDLTERLLDVGMQLIAERGADALNTDVITARAHAGKAGFYRRWPDMDHFLAAIARRLSAAPVVYVDGGTLADDLAGLLWHQVSGQRGLVTAALLSRLPHSPALRDRWVLDGPLDQLLTQCQLLVGRHGHSVSGRWFHEVADGAVRVVSHLLAARLIAEHQVEPSRWAVQAEAEALVADATRRAGASS